MLVTFVVIVVASRRATTKVWRHRARTRTDMI